MRADPVAMQGTNIFFVFLGPGQNENTSRRNRILRDFLAGLLLSAALAGAWHLFGKTPAGEGLRTITYRLLQSRLTTDAKLPVTLVDISSVRPEGPNEVTSRTFLRELLVALAAFKPKVIGIDIDFSPELDAERQVGKFMSRADPAFFDFCLKQTDRGLPVYLGVSRTQGLPPAFWLGLPEYAKLAAAILAREDSRSVPQSLGVAGLLDGDGVTADRKEEGRTMSAALSSAFMEHSAPLKRRWPLETVSKVELNGGKVQESVVDYSMIQRLKDTAIRIQAGAPGHSDWLQIVLASRREDIEGQMVLVGDVSHAEDSFDHPVKTGVVPGIVLHASAAYTATNPLSVIREGWVELADFLLAAALLLIIVAVRLSSGPTMVEEKLQTSLSWALAGAVLLFGAFVNLHHVLWDDCLMVALALALHPFADRWFGSYWEWLHKPAVAREQES